MDRLFNYISSNIDGPLADLVILGTVLIIILISYLVMRYIVLRSVFHLFKRTSIEFDDILIERGFFNRLSYAVPILILYNISTDTHHIEVPLFVSRVLLASVAAVVIASINSIISALGDIFSKTRLGDKVNIKSYVQIARLTFNLLSLILVISILIGQSPLYLLSGIGALTAVLMLVFKDTILSFVSSIQITSNDLFKLGDWIEAPQFGADGDVIDIALHTIKIQNWDKTITVIPTHKLIDSSFKNWRGMSESGGRRIKRSIMIDVNSVRFCNKQMIERFKKINIISDYISDKLSDIDTHNSAIDSSDESVVNGRALTNLGTYRAYIKNYLKSNKHISDNMTFLVRQLEAGPEGVPIQIYVFSNDTDWIRYESIQSDIFDHLIAAVSEFNLRVFQNPTGNDLWRV